MAIGEMIAANKMLLWYLQPSALSAACLSNADRKAGYDWLKAEGPGLRRVEFRAGLPVNTFSIGSKMR
jgi:hypothetical protein